jgi:maleylacetoacetate isomerase/maleylpyruvate isomerase
VKLYSYFRSSASYRVRIALALKKLDYEYLPVHLVKNEQLAPAFRDISPAQLVPALVVDDAEAEGRAPATITQSLAIIEYLDETVPEPRLLPADALGRARVRALALDVACEIHPLDNLRVLRYLQGELKISEDDKNRWYRHWVETGLEVVERQLAGHPSTGRFCHGDAPGLADCVLVPQIFNARRMECRLDHVPTVMRIFDACMAEPAFALTQPSACPDAT